MKALYLTVALLFLCVTAAWGQSDTIKKLANYSGPAADYEKMLHEGAKKEGKVVWYTSLGGKSWKTIKAEFAKKYPDVKIEVYRAGSKDISSKVFAESKARKHLAGRHRDHARDHAVVPRGEDHHALYQPGA